VPSSLCTFKVRLHQVSLDVDPQGSLKCRKCDGCILKRPPRALLSTKKSTGPPEARSCANKMSFRFLRAVTNSRSSTKCFPGHSRLSCGLSQRLKPNAARLNRSFCGFEMGLSVGMLWRCSAMDCVVYPRRISSVSIIIFFAVIICHERRY